MRKRPIKKEIFMEKIKITVMRKASYEDLSALYENPLTSPCQMEVGQVFFSENAHKPSGFCESAWQNLYPFVMTLASGGKDIFDGWMKNEKSAMISCNDGFRPVSFLLEVLED